METLWIGLVILTLSFGLGAGIARLLLPPQLTSLRLWLSPWFGLGGIAVFGGILSIAKLPMQAAYLVIIATGLLLTLYSFLGSKLRELKLAKEHLVLAGLVTVLFLLNVYPLFTRIGYPTTLSMGNLDPVAYMNVGEYLRDHTVLDGSKMNVLSPATWSVVDLLHYSFRTGPSLILSFFAAILHVKTHVIYTVLLSMVFALTFPLVYLLGKHLLTKASPILMWVTFLAYGLNATLLYWLTQGFLPQFLYGGFFVASILLVLAYPKEAQVRWRITAWDTALGMCFAAIMTIYPDGLLLAFSPIMLSGVIGFLRARNVHFLLPGLKIAGMALVINPISFATALRQIMRLVSTTTNTTFIGWEQIRTSSLFEMMGFHNLYYARNLPIWADILLSLPVLYCMIQAARYVKSKTVVGSYLTVMLAFLGFYIFIVDNFFVFNRVVGYTLFMWVTLFAVGVTRVLARINRIMITYALLSILTLVTLRTTLRSMQQQYYHTRVVDHALSSLALIPPISEPFYTADIVLGEFDLWKRVWQEHFLRGQTIIDRQNYTLLLPSQRDLDLMLVEREQAIQHPRQFAFTSVVWENKWYILGRVPHIVVSEDLQ